MKVDLAAHSSRSSVYRIPLQSKARHTLPVHGRPSSVPISSAVFGVLLAVVAVVGCSGRVDTQCSQASECPAGASCISEPVREASAMFSLRATATRAAAASTSVCTPVGNPCPATGTVPAARPAASTASARPPSCTSAIDCGLEQVCIQGSALRSGTPLPPVPDGGFPPPPPDAGPTCVNLQCAQVTCSDGGTTTLMGSVFDPSGQVPLYNAVVYVPNGEVKPVHARGDLRSAAAAPPPVTRWSSRSPTRPAPSRSRTCPRARASRW